MKKIFAITIIIVVVFQGNTDAQSFENQSTVETIKTVFKLVQRGYDRHQPKSLLKAAELMVSSPQIKPIKTSGIGEEYNYFDARTLLDTAQSWMPKFAPFLKRRIAKLEESIPKYIKMSVGSGQVNTRTFSVDPKQTKLIDADFLKDEKVNVSVFLGEHFDLSVIEATNNNLLIKGKHVGEDCLAMFTSKTSGKHYIKIENRLDQRIEGALIIEKK